jgi:hypothetical protein
MWLMMVKILLKVTWEVATEDAKAHTPNYQSTQPPI